MNEMRSLTCMDEKNETKTKTKTIIDTIALQITFPFIPHVHILSSTVLKVSFNYHLFRVQAT